MWNTADLAMVQKMNIDALHKEGKSQRVITERGGSSRSAVSNQIKSLLLSHHHSTSALVSEILISVLQTVQKNNRQFTYGQTVQKTTTNNLHMDRQCKKTALEHLQCSRQCKKNNSNLHMDRQCKKTTAIYIWTVHIYRLYRRQCAKYTYSGYGKYSDPLQFFTLCYIAAIC